MSDFFSILWTIVSFILGMAWGLVWFVLRDLISTVLWLGIVVWLGFVLRHRSFGQGSLAMLRIGRQGAAFVWRWVRGKSTSAALAAAAAAVVAEPVTKVVKEYRSRVPYGYASISDQMNALIIALIILMANI